MKKAGGSRLLSCCHHPGTRLVLPLLPSSTCSAQSMGGVDGLSQDLTQAPLAMAGWPKTALWHLSFLQLKEKGIFLSLLPATVQR